MESWSMIIAAVECLFSDDIGLGYVLCSNKISTREIVKNYPAKWARNNKMKFGINKYSILIVQGEVSKFLK